MQLPNQSSVVILGAGIAGLMCAYQLHQAGIDVCIIERGECGSGCSNAAGGILFPLKPWNYAVKLVEDIIQSNIVLPKISKKLHQSTGIDTECIQSGICFLDSNPLQSLMNCLHGFSLQNEQFDENKLHCRVFRNTDTSFKSAIYISDIYQINPPELILALRNYCHLHKIPLIEHCHAERIVAEENRVFVHTSHGIVESNQAVICLGAWSQLFLTGSQLASPPVTPIKGQMLEYSPVDTPLEPILVHEGYYLIPRRDGSIVAGSTLEHAGFDNSNTSQARKIIHQHALEAWPALRDSRIVRHWSGLRPGTDNNQAYVGAHSQHPNVWLNYGHHRYGFALSVSSAQTIVSGILSAFTA